MNSKIGIFGGTFDPVHMAHITIAECFLNQMNLDKCIFVPAFISPFKTDSRPVSSPLHRLKMLELALADNKLFEIDDYEISKSDISYTYNTIEYLKDKNPSSDLFLLIGADQAKDFTKWYNWEAILNEVQLCIALRPGYNELNEDFMIIEQLSICGKKPLQLNLPELNVSSSAIRENITLSNDINDLVPFKVLEYIKLNNLYL